MSPTRLLARPMLAAYFIADGIDAARHPEQHTARFAKVTPLLEKAGAPPVLATDAELLARATGVVSALAGLSLALGRRPRTAALVLATVNIPITLLNNPVWEKDDVPAKEKVRGLLRGLGLGGGLLLAAADRDGKPSLAWRYRTGSEHRAELSDVKADFRAQLKEQKAALKERYAG